VSIESMRKVAYIYRGPEVCTCGNAKLSMGHSSHKGLSTFPTPLKHDAAIFGETGALEITCYCVSKSMLSRSCMTQESNP
jgi:hypothetical protein